MKKVLEFFWKQKGIMPAVLIAAFTGGSLYAYQIPAVEKPNVNVVSAAEMDAEENKTEVEDAVSEGIDKEDGTYQGTGTGYGGPITVEVTVKDNKIVSINIISASGETSSFLSRAKAVIDEIIHQQKMDVDTVSGATYSSRGIIEAVKNALTGEKSTSTVAVSSAANSSSPAPVAAVSENKKWKDGTYEGSAQGFGGTITVQVTIKDGKIKTIKIKSAAGETVSYLKKAKKLTKTMVKKQSTNVDAISGATYSSNGIILATRNALSKAAVSSSDKASDKNTKSTSTEKSTSGAGKSGQFPYPDGVYYGTGEGFEGDITVAITIRDKTIKAVVITECEDDEPYITKAKAILDEVVKQQKADVDAVSGATFSSKGIIQAIKNALAEAKKAAGVKEETTDTSDKTDNNSGSNQNSGNSQNSTGNQTQEPSSENQENVFVYNSGTFSASSRVYDVDEDFWDYDITVSITIESDKITAVNVDASSTDKINQSYTNMAVKKIVPKITEKGTPDVDIVSGATCSSKAIIEGCKAALASAKK